MTTRADKWGLLLSSLREPFAVSGRSYAKKMVTGIVASLAVLISILSSPNIFGVFGAGLALIVLAIAIIDFNSYIIPDWLNAAAFGLALLSAFLQDLDGGWWTICLAILRGAVVAALFLMVRAAYFSVRGRHGIGLGDVKLAAVAGAWLDWLVLPLAIELAAIAAISFVMLRAVILGRRVSSTTRIAFGVFFAPAIWTCWVLEKVWMGPFFLVD